MMRRSCYLIAGALLATALAMPAVAQRADLPPPELVAAALDNHPAVQAAAARVAVANAQAGMLRAGEHEVTVQSGYIRRNVDIEGEFNEFDTTISRPFRLPGKARLDRKAGVLGIDVAQNLMSEVRHDTALLFGALWYDWLTASAQARNDQASASSLDRAVVAIDRRIALRDAAPLEGDQARSALALARGQVAASRAKAATARAVLAARFPDLPLPVEAPALAEPGRGSGRFEQLRDEVIEHSHALGAARAQAARQDVLASRARADRMADPTLGVRVFSERSGIEKGAGIVASIPLGGRYRARAADEAGALARSAALELSVVERDVEAAANADMSDARMLLAAWSEIAEAGRRADAVVERTQRGHALGAIDLADLLYAERQAQEAHRAEIGARGEALRAMLKLEIDAHQIWQAPER